MVTKTALVSVEEVGRLASPSERGVAFALIGISVAGTYFGMVNGQWVWDVRMIGVALVWQLVVSILQYSHIRDWRSAWYLVPLMVSVVPSVWGYGTLLVPHLVKVVPQLGTVWSSVVAWSLVLGASVATDILPERILVDRSKRGGRPPMQAGSPPVKVGGLQGERKAGGDA